VSANDTQAVVTRFAPSPTGFLHIGSARTALFNWLFSRHHGGKFLLRIEDTDRARSTKEAIDAIIDGMQWLGLDWDEEPHFQSEFADRHAEVAHQLLESGHAYRCYMSAEELQAMRAQAEAERRPFRVRSPWRDCPPDQAAPDGTPYVVRLRAAQEGETVIEDRVQGRVAVQNSEIDDFVLLRSDGTPTYMLAVVVDDHDMGVTHVIRGDDHLNNAFRQLAIIRAMDWPEPVYAHVPLIHGQDGAKMSKRHGATGVDAYRDELGILPEALFNYLLRLGWGHGDDEIISREEATRWFDLDHVGRSPARFDLKKLENGGPEAAGQEPPRAGRRQRVPVQEGTAGPRRTRRRAATGRCV
jgi:glutamyl-tRNA synthetase